MSRNALASPPSAIGGTIFAAIGAFFTITSLNLDIGTPAQMGPGFFPLTLGIILIGLGLVIVINAFQVSDDDHSEENVFGNLPVRGTLCIIAAPFVFGLTVRPLGFAIAIFLTTLVASFASMKMRIGMALILATVMTVFSVVAFVYGLSLPFRLFGPWLGI